MELQADIVAKIKRLEEKYAAMGQDMSSYLEGLIYTDYLQYWDYVHLDVLLNLQHPRTDLPDEKIFIVYHQITELYFNLVLHELEQIGEAKNAEANWVLARVKRINRYFQALKTSFGIMVDGMEKEQFLKFRMALLPASGFQSVQYRKIEICATDFSNLIDKDHRNPEVLNAPIAKQFEHIYWNKGATELSTGRKTLTLLQFEKKYAEELIRLAEKQQQHNLYLVYRNLPDSPEKTALSEALREFDVHVNINWPLVHYKSAVRYLQRSPEDIAATGGTNWQKYLPPRFQKRIFYPELWSAEEMANWGKGWVEESLRGE
ncbi:MAG: tryptophan 2,3-dioxygenase family protein [Bacteroidia bacterium]